MEREEVETIPWSNLVIEPEPRFDRRWIAYAAVGAALVMAIAGFRAISGGSQPAPRVAAQVPPTPTTAPEAGMVVSEEDLRSGIGNETGHIALRAEWFVTDFFTSDGSSETERSIRAALHPTAQAADIAAIRSESSTGTFVEWSRTLEVSRDGAGYRAVVAYRSLTRVGSDYRREPVRAVEVGIQVLDGVPLISSLPVEVEGFWEGSVGEG